MCRKSMNTNKLFIHIRGTVNKYHTETNAEISMIIKINGCFDWKMVASLYGHHRQTGCKDSQLTAHVYHPSR